MKKRFLSVLVMLALIITTIYIYETASNTTFNKIILDQVNVDEITSIESIKSGDDKKTDEEVITVEGSEEIKRILDYFSNIELKDISSVPNNYTESYQIILRTKEGRRFGIELYDENYLSIYDYKATAKGNSLFKITNHIDPGSIQKLLESKS